jgi:vitamin B12 transporter
LAAARFPKICSLLAALLLVSVAGARGSEIDDREVLGLYGGEQGYASSSSSARPTSRIAENVTVISAEQIARLNVHTLAELLNTVSGIQMENVRTPGSWTDFSLQGASNAHLQLLIDGVPQGNLLQNQVDPGLIAVQQIEQVEIIKGAASAAWGQALGGVINVITKSANPERPASGTISSSIGERFTSDLHAEFSGTVERFGYYISGGNLHSDGLLHNTDVDRNNIYAKFTYQLPVGNLTFGSDFVASSRGINETASTHDGASGDRGYLFLNYHLPLASFLSLDFDLRERRIREKAFQGDYFGAEVIPYREYRMKESTLGGSTKFTLGSPEASLVGGVQYEHASIRQWEILQPAQTAPYNTDRTWDRWGVFGNGSLSLGGLTLLPGIRLDHTGIDSNALSYTVGATYLLTEKTVLRGYFARGYSPPVAVFHNGLQKVQTHQLGIETGDIPFLWLKGTYFYNNIWNVEVADFDPLNPKVNLGKQVKKGFEVEARTVPVFDVALSTGYTFVDARDKETGLRLYDVPQDGIKLGLHYDNPLLGLSGVLTGNYVHWNAKPGNEAREHSFVWDLSLTQKLSAEKEHTPELFFSLHNIFDTGQYLTSNMQNAGRWLEGGARFRF